MSRPAGATPPGRGAGLPAAQAAMAAAQAAIAAARAACPAPPGDAARALDEAAAQSRPNPQALARCVALLLREGLAGPAAGLAAALGDAFPNAPPGHVARARVAEARGDWASAADAWGAAVARDARPDRTAWRLARGRALLRARRPESAEAAFRELLAAMPDEEGAALGLLQAIGAAPDPAPRVLHEIEAGALRQSGSARVQFAAAQALVRLRRLPEARLALQRGLARCETPAAFEQGFTLIPRLFEEPARRSLWQALEAGLPAAGPEDPHALLRVRLALACGDTRRFVTAGRALLARGVAGPLALPLASAVRALGGAAPARPKVFGIGLSKTGTSSLRSALEVLGLSAVHWTNPLTNALLGPEDVPLFDALTDTSITEIFEALHAQWPDARFILTRRPLAGWLDSFARHYARAHGTGDFATLRGLLARPDSFHYGERWRRLQRSLYFDHDSLTAAWHAHEARVRGHFRDRPGALLELDIFSGQGWPELCGFLGLPIPDRPYPWDNAAPASGTG